MRPRSNNQQKNVLPIANKCRVHQPRLKPPSVAVLNDGTAPRSASLVAELATGSDG
jgi:hypothetical protein